MGISKKQAIRDYALLNASQKTSEFELDCKALESKYKMSFQEFDQKLHSEDKEIFEEEDDYLAWKFALEGFAYWKEKVERLKKNDDLGY